MTAAARSAPRPAGATGSGSAPARKGLHARILDVLARRAGACSTATVRDALNDGGVDDDTIVERVYAVLVALERKGLVRRVPNPVGSRPLWELNRADPPTRLPDDAALAAYTLEDRLGRIGSPVQAQALATVILGGWNTGAWQRWKPAATAPLAGWLYAASRVDAPGCRVDWIMRALAHRAQWSRAAGHVTHHHQLQESLRSVSRLDDRGFADIGLLLVVALSPWSSCSDSSAAVLSVGER